MSENKKSGNLLLFSYLLNNNRAFVKSLKIAIGRFVVKYINSNYPFVLSVDSINKLDRIILAKTFLQTKPDLKEKFNIKDSFLQDIAQFIDLKIPYHYWVLINNHQRGYNEYRGIYSVPDLIFTYTNNYKIEPRMLHMFNIRNLVKEDSYNAFSNDPNDRFYKNHCYDFVIKNLHRFVEIYDEEIPAVVTCECRSKGLWDAYWYCVWKCEFDKNDELIAIHFDQDYLNYFFDGDTEKAMKEADWNDGMFDKLYILVCKQCGSWYVWDKERC
ncbi:hypothetical protein [Desulfosporosinus sp. SB140]|uniref:hypothetical protein n=1 Tax=Desulfosporosinus paludis TaxID=3115649 RepID=UPI00388EC5D0